MNNNNNDNDIFDPQRHALAAGAAPEDGEEEKRAVTSSSSDDGNNSSEDGGCGTAEAKDFESSGSASPPAAKKRPAAYKDHSQDEEDGPELKKSNKGDSSSLHRGEGNSQNSVGSNGNATANGSNSTQKEPTFPVKLHMILSNPEYQDIIAWLPHGRSWRILQQKSFEERVIPRYFRHGRYSSFARQVNGWGFRRINHGSDYNSYYHELFLRGHSHLCGKMRRLTSKDIKKRKSTEDETPPDFYALSREHPLPENDANATEGLQNMLTLVPPAIAAANMQANNAIQNSVAPSTTNVTGAAGTSTISSSMADLELARLERRRVELLESINQLLAQHLQGGARPVPASQTAPASTNPQDLLAMLLGQQARAPVPIPTPPPPNPTPPPPPQTNNIASIMAALAHVSKNINNQNPPQASGSAFTASAPSLLASACAGNAPQGSAVSQQNGDANAKLIQIALAAVRQQQQQQQQQQQSQLQTPQNNGSAALMQLVQNLTNSTARPQQPQQPNSTTVPNAAALAQLLSQNFGLQSLYSQPQNMSSGNSVPSAPPQARPPITSSSISNSVPDSSQGHVMSSAETTNMLLQRLLDSSKSKHSAQQRQN